MDTIAREHSDKAKSSVPLSSRVDGSKSYLRSLDKFTYNLLLELMNNNADSLSVISKSRSDHIHNLKVLLHYLAMELSRPEIRGVAISLRPESYGKDDYENLSYNRMIRIINMLVGEDNQQGHWCRTEGMFFDRDKGYGTRTRIYANELLADRMVKADLIFPTFPYKPKRQNPIVSPLQLSLDSGPVGDDDDSRRVALNRELTNSEAVIPLLTARLKAVKPKIVLETYQQYERSFRWDHKRQGLRSRLYEGNYQFYRLMSGEDGRGARVYGHWIQRVPSEYRQFIRFKGEQVTEYDFRAMQPALAYSSIGQAYEGDPYELPRHPSSSYRDKFKLVFRVSVGCGPRDDVIGAVRGAMHKEGLNPKAGEAEKLYQAFWQHHPLIAHVAGSDAWAWLQKDESDISLEIVHSLLDQGIPCCPIFDSFIVAEKHGPALEKAMRDAVAGLSNPPVPVKKF